jgi:hypothetical protein
MLRMDTGIATMGVALRPTLVATVVEDGAVLLDLESKYFYKLNESGWAILQLFELQSASVGDVVEQCRKWGAGDQDIPAIRNFLDHCRNENVIEEQPAVPISPPAYGGPWVAPALERQAEPLQTIVTSAFDPSIPLAE